MISLFKTGYSQNFSDGRINFGVNAGGSKLLTEIPYDFSQTINEFRNKTGFAYSFEISKFIATRWEIGAEFGYASLNGNTNTPEFSAEGNHVGTPREINDPVEYINNLTGANFFSRYFFNPVNAESVFTPFVSFGGGILNYLSKFKYIDAPDNELIFGKGKEGYTKLSTPVFILGTGFKSALSSKFHLIASVDFNFVNYDFLDVVHNYDTSGNRIDLLGLYSEFKIGIFYSLEISGVNSKGQKNKFKGSLNEKPHLPFSKIK